MGELDRRVPVRRRAVRTGQRAVRLRLVPLPNLPAVSAARPPWLSPAFRKQDFAWTEGQELVRWIDSSSFGRRAFCSKCGSPLQVRVNAPARNRGFPDRNLGRSRCGHTRSSTSSGTAGSPGSIPMTACRGTQNSGPKRAALKARSLPTRRRSPEAQANRLPRDCPRATAGSGCAEQRRPSGRSAGRP